MAAEDVLILQADADTEYRRGYVQAMRAAATAAGSGAMLEGATRRPAEFEVAHPVYVRAERHVDADVEPLAAADADDVVVDDKVCGYRLADYLTWGGLFEEWNDAGEPVHAETTRLFIRARLIAGARKLRVNAAGAASSRRRVLQDPWLQFATAGFPRESSWMRTVPSRHGRDVDEFGRSLLAGEEPLAAFLRRAHGLPLFRLLPAMICDALSGRNGSSPVLGRKSMPPFSAAAIAARPGVALGHVLKLIDDAPELFA